MKKLRASGGYHKSASFQTATLVYDATYWFCEKFVDSKSRTQDQMIQAARSGRQNIAEGSPVLLQLLHRPSCGWSMWRDRASKSFCSISWTTLETVRIEGDL